MSMTYIKRCNVAMAGTLMGCLLVAARVQAETSTAAQIKPDPLVSLMAGELDYSMAHLVSEDGTKPYFLNYTVYDEHRMVIGASLGALSRRRVTTERNLNIDLRVGDYAVDNTHQLRGGGASHESGSGAIPIAMDGEPNAIRHALWYHTDRIFKRAAHRLAKIKTNLKVKVEEEDQSDDFSKEPAHQHYDAVAALAVDAEAWAKRLRRISLLAKKHPLIYQSGVILGAYAGTRYMVNSTGTRLQTSETRYRLTLQATTVADDGMDLSQSTDFNARDINGLPGDAEIEAAFQKVIQQVLALRKAPLAEPYVGPAILRNRASAVFFHEIFGHRIEGHRQKDVTEGQTFTKKIGEPVLPEFLSVYDNPLLDRLGDIDLRGYYQYDDEGVPAENVTLVEHGVLSTFLMSRRPVDRFPRSNGHGRRQSGHAVVSRQANLLVKSEKQTSFAGLRKQLIKECRRQDKPYGLLFEDISGGFTMTGRQGPQSFKVLPVVVYRVFVDGRPDELIRGVDVVGTPLTSFAKITYTGDDPAVFNGTCGAESGWVPVSAISPSILVSTIEIEKRQRSQDRPPILPSPLRQISTAVAPTGNGPS